MICVCNDWAGESALFELTGVEGERKPTDWKDRSVRWWKIGEIKSKRLVGWWSRQRWCTSLWGDGKQVDKVHENETRNCFIAHKEMIMRHYILYIGACFGDRGPLERFVRRFSDDPIGSLLVLLLTMTSSLTIAWPNNGRLSLNDLRCVCSSLFWLNILAISRIRYNMYLCRVIPNEVRSVSTANECKQRQLHQSTSMWSFLCWRQ